MRARALTVIALVASGCASNPPSVRYSGDVMSTSPAESVRTYDAEPPCGLLAVGTVEVTCPSGCTFDEAITMAKNRVAHAGVDGIFKVRTTMRKSRVRLLQADAAIGLPCVGPDQPAMRDLIRREHPAAPQ